MSLVMKRERVIFPYYNITRMKIQTFILLALVLITVITEIPHYTKKQIA
jgi:hypothetical protein